MLQKELCSHFQLRTGRNTHNILISGIEKVCRYVLIWRISLLISSLVAWKPEKFEFGTGMIVVFTYKQEQDTTTQKKSHNFVILHPPQQNNDGSLHAGGTHSLVFPKDRGR